MARYRRVDIRIWGDSKFRAFDEPTKLLWFYLLTGPETSQIPGVLLIGEAGLAEALGWSMQQFRNRFETVSKAGMAVADWSSRIVFLPHAIKYAEPNNQNIIKGWADAFALLPESFLVPIIAQTIAEGLQGLVGVASGEDNGFETVSKRYAELFRNRLPNRFELATATATGTGTGIIGVPDGAAPSPRKPDPHKPAVDRLAARWLAHHGSTGRVTMKHRGHLRARLVAGYTEEQLGAAIDHVATDPWFPEHGQVRLANACDSDERIEKRLAELARVAVRPSPQAPTKPVKDPEVESIFWAMNDALIDGIMLRTEDAQAIRAKGLTADDVRRGLAPVYRQISTVEQVWSALSGGTT